MSTNLHLSATRIVFTKSGVEITMRENVDMWQTPTKTTDYIMSLPTFDEKLNAYCEWAKERGSEELDDSPGSFFWHEVYDDSPEPREKEYYFNLDDGFWDEFQYVSKVVLKGEPLFDEIRRAQQERDLLIEPFLHEGAEDGMYGVGFRIITTANHDVVFRKTVEKMLEQEWELEFYSL